MGQPVSYRDKLGTLNISRGVIDTAKKVVIYGPEGIGKSTLASKFPFPVFLDVEGSTKAMQVDRVDGLTTWQALRDTMSVLRSSGHDYKTVVIDTADWAEKLASAYVCEQNKVRGIEAFGYGKGYTYLKEAFAELLADCDALISRKINVVFTAHAAMRKFEQPDERGAYDRWEMKLSRQVAPLLKEWADMVLFCNYKTFAQKQENGKYKVTGGERTMYTTHNPCWDAKNRYALADELPMDYAQLAAAVEIRHPEPAPVPETPKPEEAPTEAPAFTPSPLICADCGQHIAGVGTHSAEAIANRSMELFGRALCVSCAVHAKETMKASS
ncbi:ATP-binding protein [Jonquetella anthropi]|uniref:ATP-binding protein n=1 Tax=Jonquetella anthropi TaxID=428712 RepID=UPI0001B915D4|nr:ATP-binding protein [Jonquetella anthropi]EEX48656.1 hypothetical protein GCWU000246_00682 [Jonquetella anthropi E3_33 E1]